MSQNIHYVTDATFDPEVLQSSTPVLVDYWAEWCGPCKMIAPLLDELADQKTGQLKVGKVNVDDDQDLAARFGIRAIPTLLLFKGGEVKEQMLGMTAKKDLEKKLAPYLA